MDTLRRYINVQGIRTNDGKLIPIWDKDLVFENNKEAGCGASVRVPNDYHTYFSLIDLVFDLKTKEISTGIIVDYYGEDSKSEFKKGQVVLVEDGKNFRHLVKTKVVDIVFEDYDIEIKKGKKLDYWVKIFQNIYPEMEIIPDQMYCIRLWKPTYVLENGFRTTYPHQLYHFDE